MKFIPDCAPHPEADPRQVSLARLDRFVDCAWVESSLENVMRDIANLTGIDMQVMWIDEDNPKLGLRPERSVTMQLQNTPLLDVLEKVLERADTRADGRGSTWQLSDTGTLQVGPRERLDRFIRTEAYDTTDLIVVVKDFDEPWSAPGAKHKEHKLTLFDKTSERGEALRAAIVATCEPSAWSDNGGVGSLVFHAQSRAMMARAPDYAHRAAFGYQFFKRPRGVQGTPDSTPAPARPAATPREQAPGSRN